MEQKKAFNEKEKQNGGNGLRLRPCKTCDAKAIVTWCKDEISFRKWSSATDAYQKECTKWDEAYGEKPTPKAETMHEKIRRYQEKADRQNTSQPYQSRDKGAR